MDDYSFVIINQQIKKKGRSILLRETSHDNTRSRVCLLLCRSIHIMSKVKRHTELLNSAVKHDKAGQQTSILKYPRIKTVILNPDKGEKL